MRRREEARPPSSGVHKHNTFPSGPTGDLPADNRSNEKERQTSDDIPSSDTAASQGGTEKGLVNGRPLREAPDSETYESVGTANGQGPRRRKLRKFLPWKKSEDDSQEPERTETSQSKKKKYPPISFMSQFKAVFGSWINILLIMVPVGFALNYSHQNGIAIFVVNFIAIIPLAAMLSYATEELAMYIGETLGGLLNATFGNAVELIVGIIALVQKKVLIVQTSLIGSMLSNLLLVMGMCFFFGGIRRSEQFFNLTVAQTAASLLALAVGALIIPTAFVQFADVDTGATPASRGTAVMLLVVYGCYLFFQLRTHVDMYNEPSKKSPKRPNGKKEAGEALHGLATIGAGTGAAAAGGHINQSNLIHEQDDEEETPQLTIMGALLTLGGSTVLVAFCAEFMVSGIDALTSSGNVSDEFVGLILLPIVGNAAEHATAVTVAIKDKMDLAIGVAVGSSLQIALLVLPIMVMLNWWGLGSPADLSLSFDGFQVSVLFIAVIVVNYVIQDGKSHWLEGVMLQITYLIIAVSAWFYPANGDVAG
ncbi:Calcium/proton exchanger [Teratosphaeria nubilosa]|uniref:Calcium/proton exchanger n=1 Tax=Teratosphaeria nubilosa TaxID=161662 RepID=A0A6G1LJY6_9PEZI|nr:Calcium/proton exchanger [Teratosphaeria nubilosa]